MPQQIVLAVRRETKQRRFAFDDCVIGEGLSALQAQILLGAIVDRLELPTNERAKALRPDRSLQEMTRVTKWHRSLSDEALADRPDR
jgi:hypothetical protein